MPLSGSTDPSGKSTARKGASVKKKTSGAPTGFTFVDQSADLRSIADKKIVDSDQRHLIRSHVMQKVRKDERLQGKKRPTGRDHPRRDSSLTPIENVSNPATTPESHHSTSVTSPFTSSDNSPSSSLSSALSSASGAISNEIIHIPKSPSQGRLDPFNTLPGGRGLAKLTNNLVGYCFHTFIPMTFPVVASSSTEYDGWRLKILQSQTANSATFFGMMAVVAVHQALNNGRHRDLRPSALRPAKGDLLLDNDFALMKSQALNATGARISRNGYDGPTVEAMFSLIGAEVMIGNFEEAQFHLSAVRKLFADGQGLDPMSPASNWIPLTDVKCAMGTMTRPLFRLPWDPEPIAQETLDKLYEWDSSDISLLGTGFHYVDALSPQLQNILQQASVICRFCQFNAVYGRGMTADEYEIFRRKTLELEYDTLSYIYPGSPTDDLQTPNHISLMEQIARLAILGTTSSVVTKVHPSCGLGRAITDFQMSSIMRYLTTLRTPPTQSIARFLVWALMVFTHCAFEQPEERHFIDNIAWFSPWAGIEDWTSLEIVCTSFLYIPAFQRTLWQQYWSRACQTQQVDHSMQMKWPARVQSGKVVLTSQKSLRSR